METFNNSTKLSSQRRLQRQPSIGPGAFFTKILIIEDGEQVLKNMLIFYRTYTQIKKKTDLLHKEIKDRFGKGYDNKKETACFAWALRTLGIINDDSLHLCIDYQKERKFGIVTETAINIYNNYFGEEIIEDSIEVPLFTVFTHLPKGSVTPITIFYVRGGAHEVLAMKTIEGRSILYDPSEYNERHRIIWASSFIGEKSKFDTIEELLVFMGSYPKIGIYVGYRNVEYPSRSKIPTQFFGGKSKRKSQKRKQRKIQTKRKYK